MSLESAFITLPILIFSAIFHEFMHAWVANKLGDPTPRLLGRLTLNPVPHIDLFSSILLPGLLLFLGSPIIFGAAKPVPVNPIHFKDPKKDMAIVALSGPLTNLVIAIAASFVLKFFGNHNYYVEVFLFAIVFYNILLTIINLIPIPPLDGSKVVASLLPERYAYSYLSIGQYGIFFLLFLLMTPAFSQLLKRLLFYALGLLGV